MMLKRKSSNVFTKRLVPILIKPLGSIELIEGDVLLRIKHASLFRPISDSYTKKEVFVNLAVAQK
jgi:hypothetical protein